MLEGRIVKAEIDEEGRELLGADACITLTCQFRVREDEDDEKEALTIKGRKENV